MYVLYVNGNKKHSGHFVGYPETYEVFMIVTCNGAHNRVLRSFYNPFICNRFFPSNGSFRGFYAARVRYAVCTVRLWVSVSTFLTCIHWIIACSCSISVFFYINKATVNSIFARIRFFFFSIRFENLQKLFTVCVYLLLQVVTFMRVSILHFMKPIGN